MAKRGPKPKPTALKLLTGNPGRRPLNDREPTPDAGRPPCPKRFSGLSRRVWYDLGAQLADCGVLTKVDGQAFELLVSTYAEWLDAIEAMRERGPVWLKKSKAAIPSCRISPYWKVANAAAARLTQMLREFGLTPSARSTLKIPHNEKPKQDPAAKYFA